MYRNISIYPKLLTTQSVFTEQEKAHLTRIGFRWYVYFSFRDPVTNKFKRQKAIYENLNRDYPDFDDRLAQVKLMQQALLESLKRGYSPYDTVNKKEKGLISSLDFALKKKSVEVGFKTMESYTIAVKRFKEWLVDNGYKHLPVHKVDKRIVNLYLNHIAALTSNRSRNNYKSSLSAIFTVLEDNDYIDRNFVRNIKDLKTAPKRDPTYSDKQVEDITDYLQKNDRVMLLFIWFVSYMFWRPKENCRLQVKDVNLEQRLIYEKTKTKGLKTKLIPDILYDDLKEYIKGAQLEDLLFTPNGPGTWERQLDNRRGYFTLRYARLKKKMNVPKEYTVYGFRHTGITKIYKALIEDHTKDKALEILASITGHTSKAMLDYIHFVDASLPDEYSKYLK
jgi:integrase